MNNKKNAVILSIFFSLCLCIGLFKLYCKPAIYNWFNSRKSIWQEKKLKDTKEKIKINKSNISTKSKKLKVNIN